MRKKIFIFWCIIVLVLFPATGVYAPSFILGVVYDSITHERLLDVYIFIYFDSRWRRCPVVIKTKTNLRGEFKISTTRMKEIRDPVFIFRKLGHKTLFSIFEGVLDAGSWYKFEMFSILLQNKHIA